MLVGRLKLEVIGYGDIKVSSRGVIDEVKDGC
jgi:hypothetical protein